jgi:hypothetical protein
MFSTCGDGVEKHTAFSVTAQVDVNNDGAALFLSSKP